MKRMLILLSLLSSISYSQVNSYKKRLGTISSRGTDYRRYDFRPEIRFDDFIQNILATANLPIDLNFKEKHFYYTVLPDPWWYQGHQVARSFYQDRGKGGEEGINVAERPIEGTIPKGYRYFYIQNIKKRFVWMELKVPKTKAFKEFYWYGVKAVEFKDGTTDFEFYHITLNEKKKKVLTELKIHEFHYIKNYGLDVLSRNVHETKPFTDKKGEEARWVSVKIFFNAPLSYVLSYDFDEFTSSTAAALHQGGSVVKVRPFSIKRPVLNFGGVNH